MVAEVGLRVALLGVDEIGKLHRVADEEDGGVVADDVPVAFCSVDFQGEAARIALGVRSAFFAGDGREAEEGFGFSADFREYFGARIF